MTPLSAGVVPFMIAVSGSLCTCQKHPRGFDAGEVLTTPSTYYIHGLAFNAPPYCRPITEYVKSLPRYLSGKGKGPPLSLTLGGHKKYAAVTVEAWNPIAGDSAYGVTDILPTNHLALGGTRRWCQTGRSLIKKIR